MGAFSCLENTFVTKLKISGNAKQPLGLQGGELRFFSCSPSRTNRHAVWRGCVQTLARLNISFPRFSVPRRTPVFTFRALVAQLPALESCSEREEFIFVPSGREKTCGHGHSPGWEESAGSKEDAFLSSKSLDKPEAMSVFRMFPQTGNLSAQPGVHDAVCPGRGQRLGWLLGQKDKSQMQESSRASELPYPHRMLRA